MLVKNVKELGHLVRDRRRRQALTQAALAARVGVSRKWVGDLEDGKPTASLGLVLRTLGVLGVELDARERTRGPRTNSAIDIDAIVETTRGRHARRR
jgi:HTH-type transcriptional regulator/antitoxin HipB